MPGIKNQQAAGGPLSGVIRQSDFTGDSGNTVSAGTIKTGTTTAMFSSVMPADWKKSSMQEQPSD